jgi:hypothetical protein
VRPGDDPDVRAFLARDYGRTPWYGRVARVFWTSGALWADTTMASDADAGESAAAVCGALSAYFAASGRSFGGVAVRAADGRRLVVRNSLDERCEAAPAGSSR